ncbi:hypothetical protein ACRRTK_001495 [Alexandromys fortis]
MLVLKPPGNLKKHTSIAATCILGAETYVSDDKEGSMRGSTGRRQPCITWLFSANRLSRHQSLHLIRIWREIWCRTWKKGHEELRFCTHGPGTVKPKQGSPYDRLGLFAFVWFVSIALAPCAVSLRVTSHHTGTIIYFTGGAPGFENADKTLASLCVTGWLKFLLKIFRQDSVSTKVCWDSKPTKIVQLPCDSQVTSSVLGDVSLEMLLIHLPGVDDRPLSPKYLRVLLCDSGIWGLQSSEVTRALENALGHQKPFESLVRHEARSCDFSDERPPSLRSVDVVSCTLPELDLVWAVESLVSVGITPGVCSPELLVGGALAWNQL